MGVHKNTCQMVGACYVQQTSRMRTTRHPEHWLIVNLHFQIGYIFGYVHFFPSALLLSLCLSIAQQQPLNLKNLRIEKVEAWVWLAATNFAGYYREREAKANDAHIWVQQAQWALKDHVSFILLELLMLPLAADSATTSQQILTCRTTSHVIGWAYE